MFWDIQPPAQIMTKMSFGWACCYKSRIELRSWTGPLGPHRVRSMLGLRPD